MLLHSRWNAYTRVRVLCARHYFSYPGLRIARDERPAERSQKESANALMEASYRGVIRQLSAVLRDTSRYSVSRTIHGFSN